MPLAQVGWTLEQGAKVVQEMEPGIRALGWFTALTGSTLHKGWGKDLDIAILNLGKEKGGTVESIVAYLHDKFKAETLTDLKYAEDVTLVMRATIQDNQVDFLIYLLGGTNATL